MSEVLSKFPKRESRTSKYPDMHEWLDGRVHVLTKGEDFDVEPASMRNTILHHARQKGLPIETMIRRDANGTPNKIIVQALSANGEVAAQRARAKAS